MNKQVIRYLKWTGKLVCVMLVAALAGCQSEDEFTSSGQTGLRLALTDAAEHTYSRKSPSELEQPLGSAFNLQVVSSGTGKTVYKGNFKESVLLKEGLYNLTASYGENPVIALDAPYYVGTLEEQKVVKGIMTSASIPCSVANALLSVIYNEETLKKVYESYQVVVSVADESVVLDASSGKSAYFRAGSSVKLLFQGKQLGSGKEVSYEIPNQEQFNAIAAKKHVKVTLGVDVASIPSGVGVSIEKLQVETVSIAETIPMEYMPKPKLEAEGFVNNELSFAETEKKLASVRLKLASPLQDLKLKFKSTDAKFASLSPEKEYLLSNTEDKAAVETALGITLPEIGSKEGTLDFTSLIPQLMTDKGVTVESVVEIDVKANNRWSSDKETDAQARTYSLKCNKPDFRVSAYPGNIWTKEFTVNHLLPKDVESGDCEALSQKMKYQFSVDGNSGWTDLGEDLRKAELTPGTTYYIRGVYRDVIESEAVAVKTYDALTIPNSTLDEGYDTTYPKDNNPLYTFRGGWIDTRNELTCHEKGVNAFYVSKSSTLPISDNGSTVAHLMMLGWGAGNTCNFGNKSGSVIYHVSSGIVCVGDYEPVEGSIKAKEASIRPTSLMFTYKAAPYSDDEYLIEIALLNVANENEKVLGYAKLQSGNPVADYTSQTLDIIYDDELKTLPITHVRVIFKAGVKEDKDHLEDKFKDASFWDGYSNAYLIGSQFWLDSFSLVYDK